MKRSLINRLIRDAEKFIRERGFYMPPFAFWTPQDWARKGLEADEIRRAMLGWDITDYGSKDFFKTGLIHFTLRNGSASDAQINRRYAEKILIIHEGQVLPWHFHHKKTEDIINRGGGILGMELAWASEDGNSFADREVTVSMDGVKRTFKSCGKVELSAGESITIPHHLYHTFYGKSGHGPILVGEVSTVNDDKSDNHFLKPAVRFVEIEEDEPVYRYLSNEYPKAQRRLG